MLKKDTHLILSCIFFSANFPPNITSANCIEAKVGEPVTLQVNAIDPNGDDVSVMLYNHVPGANLSQGESE